MPNDFDPVAKIIEYWRFENNLTAGKAGNDLTASAGGVGYASASPLEGSYSLDLESGSNQWASRDDASLSSGFPLKSGDSTKKVSWACWIKPESTPASYPYIISKWVSSTGKRGLALVQYSTSLRLLYSYDGTNFNEWTICTIAAGSIYHVGVAIDGLARIGLARVYMATATTYNYSFSGDLNIPDSTVPFVIGNRGDLGTSNDYDGLIDEVVVANDLLSAAEFDAIRGGTFNQANPATLIMAPSLGHVWLPGNNPYQPFIIF